MISRLRIAVALAVIVAVTPASPSAPMADAKVPPSHQEILQQVVDRLGLLAPSFDPYGTQALTVARLDDRTRAAFQGDVQIKSASVTKVLWVAAAVRHVGVEAAASVAQRALYASSNEAAGSALDLSGGIDATNRYVHDLGLNDTTVYEWSFGGRDRRSRFYPGPLRGLNLTTTDDLVDFWQMLAYGYALQGDERAAVLDWTTGYKEDGEGNRLVNRLPKEVADASQWKMGWLPVGRTYLLEDDETGWGGEEGGTEVTLTGGAVSSAGGLIRIPHGPTYAIGVASYNGRSWAGMTSWVEYASCVVYSVIAEEPRDCVTSRDPGRIQSHATAPLGSLEAVGERNGFIEVHGWAADPDAWWGRTFVTFTVDGVRVGGRASGNPTTAEEIIAPRFDRTLLFEASRGLHEVCAIALNDGAGDDTPIGCFEVAVG